VTLLARPSCYSFFAMYAFFFFGRPYLCFTARRHSLFCKVGSTEITVRQPREKVTQVCLWSLIDLPLRSGFFVFPPIAPPCPPRIELEPSAASLCVFSLHFYDASFFIFLIIAVTVFTSSARKDCLHSFPPLFFFFRGEFFTVFYFNPDPPSLSHRVIHFSVCPFCSPPPVFPGMFCCLFVCRLIFFFFIARMPTTLAVLPPICPDVPDFSRPFSIPGSFFFPHPRFFFLL